MDLLLSLLIIPIAIVLLWAFLSSILALISGWTSLGRKFAEPRALNGAAYRGVSANMGWLLVFVSYGGVIRVTLNEFGLGLSLAMSYKRTSPNLFIPWEEIESMKARNFWLFSSVRIKVKGFSRRIRIYGQPSMRIYEVFKDCGPMK